MDGWVGTYCEDVKHKVVILSTLMPLWLKLGGYVFPFRHAVVRAKGEQWLLGGASCLRQGPCSSHEATAGPAQASTARPTGFRTQGEG